MSPSSPEPSPSPASRPRLPARLLLSEHMVLVVSLALWFLLSPFVPGFGSAANMGHVASNLAPLLVLAIGQTFVLIAGGIDLSITATIALASVVGASIMTSDPGSPSDRPLAIAAAVLAMAAIGLLVGLINGLSVARLGMPPFMVTLATMMAVGGLAVWYTRSEKIIGLPESFVELGYGRVFGLPIAWLVVGTIALGARFALRSTVFGRWLYAVGRNPKAAGISGVPTARVVTAVYIASGLCAVVGSMLYTARLMTGSPETSPRLLLDVIGACVIGGTSLFGGRGKILWTAYGALFIASIDNLLNLMNLSNFMVMIVKGAVILAAALVDAGRARSEGAR